MSSLPFFMALLQPPLIGKEVVEEVPSWSTSEPLTGSEVDVRHLRRPPAGILGVVPLLLLGLPRALTGEEKEQWLRYKAESSIWPTQFSLLSVFVHSVFIPDTCGVPGGIRKGQNDRVRTQ